jgi:hypothetical protein
MEEPLERFDLRDPIEELGLVQRLGGRTEQARLGGMSQPGALRRQKDVREIVADARAVDAPQLLDGFPRPTSEAGSARRSASATPCVCRSSEGSPQGGEPSGSRRAPRWPYLRIDSVRFTAPTIF